MDLAGWNDQFREQYSDKGSYMDEDNDDDTSTWWCSRDRGLNYSREMLREDLEVVPYHREGGAGYQWESSTDLPFLDMTQSHDSSGQSRSTISRGRSTYESSSGQLKIAVYRNCGLLTVHIIKGRHLSLPYRAPCSAYVKISLLPNTERRSKCKTNVVPNTDHPTFDEKFSFELLEEDRRKRLYISVWNKNSNGSSDFLGCTSFGIRHLESKHRVIDAWYFLMTEDLGRKKHLKVAQQEDNLVTSTPKRKTRTPSSDYEQYPDETIPSMLSLNMLNATNNYTVAPSELKLSMLNTSTKSTKRRVDEQVSKSRVDVAVSKSKVDAPVSKSRVDVPVSKSKVDAPVSKSRVNGPGSKSPLSMIVIHRNSSGGCGFSMRGASPVTVCSVQPYGPAMEAGLREDDIIEKLNARDVQFCSADLLAGLISQTPGCIILEVRRKTKPWTVWKPPTISEIPEYVSARCPSPTSLSCDLISGICSFGKQKKKSKHY